MQFGDADEIFHFQMAPCSFLDSIFQDLFINLINSLIRARDRSRADMLAWESPILEYPPLVSTFFVVLQVSCVLHSIGFVMPLFFLQLSSL